MIRVLRITTVLLLATVSVPRTQREENVSPVTTALKAQTNPHRAKKASIVPRLRWLTSLATAIRVSTALEAHPELTRLMVSLEMCALSEDIVVCI